MVLAAAPHVKAIHCEKPMARTWGEARAMAQACAEHGVQLTFNHQRRFNQPFRVARDLLGSGAIGRLQRMEANCGNLYDWGTHWFDMFGFFNDESPARWVMGQIDVRTDQKVFGVPVEDFGLSYIAYQNGVYGLLVAGPPEDSGLGCAIRLIGSDGAIEILWDAPHLRVRSAGDAGWRVLDQVTESIHDAAAQPKVMADIAESLSTGREPELSARRALNATEVIFATYESSRRRARVDTPLTIDDSPIQALLDAGEIAPRL
jgi:predicted dehydrogenase